MNVLVVLAAKVESDGKPTGAMKRRTEAALAAGRMLGEAVFLVTGSREEAGAMRILLESQGVQRTDIIDESSSDDTLSSVVHCSAILAKRLPTDTIRIYSDRYHIPRTRWLFHLCGISTLSGIVPSGLQKNGLPRWCFYYFREAAAIVVDTVLMWVSRIR